MEKNKLEYWIFIDDSGNIELSSDDKYFIYGALVFNNLSDVENYKKEHEKTLVKLFKNKKEVKASHNISTWKREELFNVLTNANCQLFSVIEEKKLSNKLKQIESDYKNDLTKTKPLPLKSKLILKKIRQKNYEYHKGYLIAQLICLIVQTVKKQKNMQINIIIDNENLSFIKDNFTDYLKYEQKYLKFRSYNYSFTMEDSKNNYCLQGTDFLANTVYRLYNKYEKEKYEYINKTKQIVTKNFPYILDKEKELQIKKEIEAELEQQKQQIKKEIKKEIEAELEQQIEKEIEK